MDSKKVYDPLVYKGTKSLTGFTHVRAYHGCRPLSIEDFKKNGIKRRHKEECFADVVDHFKTLLLPEDAIRNAFEETWDEYNKDNTLNAGVYLNLWRDEYFRYSGHYLIYGSEFLSATAVKLSSNEWEATRYRDEMKKAGRPTLVVCDVPIADIVPAFRNSIESAMPINSDTSILVPGVHPESIVSFEFPTVIPDPFYNYMKYRFTEDSIQ